MLKNKHHSLVKAIYKDELNSCNHKINHEFDDKNIEIHLNSRSHRKKRSHPIFINGVLQKHRQSKLKLFTVQLANLSWWVAFLFTIGSLVWLINGIYAMWPTSPAEVQTQISAWTAFMGGGIFIIGGIAAYLEVINRPSFIHLRIPDNLKKKHFLLHYSNHPFKHIEKFLVKRIQFELKNWAWWLNFIQLIGATVFFLACVIGVLLSVIKDIPVYNWFWLPQMIGSVCFFISSFMAMLEVQSKFYLPAWNKIGWWSALFNLIGAVGFFLCAFYGAYYQSQAFLYWGSNLSTFIGSIAFLISSYLMLIEVINPKI
jgi:MFS family permease